MNYLIKGVLLLGVVSFFGLIINQMVREYYWLQSLGGLNSIFDYGDDI